MTVEVRLDHVRVLPQCCPERLTERLKLLNVIGRRKRHFDEERGDRFANSKRKSDDSNHDSNTDGAEDNKFVGVRAVYDRQYDGVNNTKTGMISIRPIHIRKVMTSFVERGNGA